MGPVCPHLFSREYHDYSTIACSIKIIVLGFFCYIRSRSFPKFQIPDAMDSFYNIYIYTLLSSSLAKYILKVSKF
jgi:hypothetical protein